MKLMAWVVAALAITFAAAPLVTDPFTGFRADQLPVPQLDPPIQPAGYAFAIWGVIYIWLIVSGVFGALKRAEDASWQATRPWLIVSLAVGTPWLAIANTSAFWATVTIWVMLGTALAALLRSPRQDRLLLRAPLALYAGWLSAASFVSLGALLAGYGILFDALDWALTLTLAATMLAATVQWKEPRAPEYGTAVAWALTAIAVKNGDTQLSLALLAAVCASAMIALAIRSARRT
ncbi:MAG: hypothetical protein AAF092_09075 [Pseudomonadota bacterium]